MLGVTHFKGGKDYFLKQVKRRNKDQHNFIKPINLSFFNKTKSEHQSELLISVKDEQCACATPSSRFITKNGFLSLYFEHVHVLDSLYMNMHVYFCIYLP